MGKGKIKHVFPGGNTSLGFYSYYHHMIGPEATRIFVLKGGPGVGKSSFMRKISEVMQERGFDVEHHHCSSDNGSLDGLVIPSIGVALLDGTAPHVVDPKHPGALDEIINLGEYWNEVKLREHKDEILSTTRRISRLFGIAYSQLAEAKVIRDEMESYVTESMDFAGVNRLTLDLIYDLFSQTPAQHRVEPKSRHLFCSAFTPDGVMHHIESLLPDVKKLYLIKGQPGSGRSTMVGRIARAAHYKGLHTEVYHCAFEPQKVDLVVIPQVKTAILKEVPEVSFDPSTVPGLRITIHNLDAYIKRTSLEPYAVELMSAKARFASALARAVRHIHDAKLTHDYLEGFYVPAMDFTAIDQRRLETTKRILSLLT